MDGNFGLVGTLPPEWGTGPGLGSLRMLMLEYTGLTGPLPPEWCSATGLASLAVLVLQSVPALNTSIPQECVRGPGLAQLKQLHLSYGARQDAGAGLESIPLLPELGRLRSLRRLYVNLWWSPSVNVTLPPEWAANDTGLTALTTLYINGPALVGSLPPEWGTWRGLSAVNHISITNTRLNGTLPATWPDQLGWASNFIAFNLQGNGGLEGSVPPEWGRFGGRLTQLYVAYTSINGTFPCSFNQPKVLGRTWFNGRQLDELYACPPPKAADVAGGATIDNTSDASGVQGECT